MTLSPQFLDELRARTTLSALIGRSVKLQRSGSEFKACCPFHTEKTPSFWVNDDKGFYHCFGCSAHGDAIRWLTDQRGLSFLDAVRELAAAAGLDMPARANRNHEQADALRHAVAAAGEWFVARLADAEGKDARAALAARGIRPETARAFGIGFAPNAHGRLRAALRSFGVPALVASGMLVSIDDREPYDRFRGRLTIPIRDARGRTIAFGGRILGAGEPKYLNSPETPLFDKGRTLYNIDRAQAAARKTGRVIAVEGYLDVIALAQSGVADVVAPLGTALTEHQFEQLWRLADCPILCFDGDVAGVRAAQRAAQRALPLLQPGKTIEIVRLPDGMDPDDLVRTQGPRAFAATMDNRRSLVDVLGDAVLADYRPDAGPDDRAAVLHRCDELAGRIRHAVIAREYRRSLRDRCWDYFRRLVPAGHAARPAVDPMVPILRAVLFGLTCNPDILHAHCESVSKLPIGDSDLAAWRDRLVDAAVLGVGLPPPPGGIAPLPFRFCQSTTEEAAADLVRTIEILLTEAGLRRAIHAARERLLHDDAALADLFQLEAERAAIARQLLENEHDRPF